MLLYKYPDYFSSKLCRPTQQTVTKKKANLSHSTRYKSPKLINKRILCPLLLLLPFHTWADSSELQQLSLEELMQVSISSITKMKMPVQDASMSAFVITDQEIKNRGYRYLLDILKNTPGIYIVPMSASEKATDEIYIRGLYANRKITLLIDGNRIKPPTGEPETFFNRIPLLNIKQVEISFGSASSLYGADAMLATINLVSQPFSKQGHADILLTGGTDNTGEVQLSAGKKISDEIAFNLSGSFQRTDGDNLAAHYPTLYTNKNVNLTEHSYNIHLKAEYLGLSFSYYRLYNKRNNSIAFNPAFFDYSGAAFWKTRNQAINLAYHWELTPFWQTRSRFSYESTELDDQSSYRAFGTIAGATWKGEVFRLAQNFIYQKGDWNWFTGLETAFFRSTPKVPLANPELGVITLHYQNYAIFSQLDYQFTNTLKLNAALRLDYDTRYYPVVNPRLGFSWNALPPLRFFGTWATSYLAPAPYLVYERWNAPGSLGHRPNLNLHPERMSTYELGATWTITAQHIVTLNGFFTQSNNLVRVEDNSALGLPNKNVNSAHGKTYGVHIYSKHQLPYGFFLNSSYQFTAGRQSSINLIQETVPLARMPQHLLQTNLEYHWQAWIFSFRTRWFDNLKSNENNNRFQGARTHGATVIDTNIHYQQQIRKVTFHADLNINNLLDQRYYQFGIDDNLTVTDPTGNQQDFFLSQLPQAGRKIYFSMGLNY